MNTLILCLYRVAGADCGLRSCGVVWGRPLLQCRRRYTMGSSAAEWRTYFVR